MSNGVHKLFASLPRHDRAALRPNGLSKSMATTCLRNEDLAAVRYQCYVNRVSGPRWSFGGVDRIV